MNNYESFLKKTFMNAVSVCLPSWSLPKYLPTDRAKGREIVLGAGKASIEMAMVLNEHFNGGVVGAVVTRHGQGESLDIGEIEKLYASHPVPDEKGLVSSQRILEIAHSVTENDRVHFLVSGGGSALLTLPAAGISLSKIQEITNHLVKSGLAIDDINCVRRHLSQVSGGRLAKAIAPAKLISYAISDVVGDSPTDIASGPTVQAVHEPDRAIQLLQESGYVTDKKLTELIEANRVPDHVNGDYKLVAKSQDSLDVIEQLLRAEGFEVINLGSDLQGEAKKVGNAHAKVINEFQTSTKKTAFISGGELTVKVSNPEGQGGPNLEYLLALILNLNESVDFAAISCDSDGIDGSEDNAGAYATNKSLLSMKTKGLDAQHHLDTNNTYALFDAINGLVKTGPTGTNINDLRIVLVET